MKISIFKQKQPFRQEPELKNSDDPVPQPLSEKDSSATKVQIQEDTSQEEILTDETTLNEETNWFEPEGELAIDVYQTDKDIVIQSAIAGIRPEDLDVTIENDMVTLRGKRNNPEETDDKQYFHQECFWGVFSRQVFLPEEVDVRSAQAMMKDGVLTLRLPKMKRERSRKVNILKK